MDVDYLLEHPAVTKEEAAKCLDSHSSNEHCKMVMTAASKLMIAISDQQSDPEAFGQRIINIEIEYAKAKEELNQIEQKEPKSTLKLNEARATLRNLETEMKMLLAIAGLSSPE